MINKSIIIAITGASGGIYAKRLFDFIHSNTQLHIRIIISEYGLCVLKNELGIEKSYFTKERATVYDNNNLNVNIASGSSRVDTMVVIPASMNAVARIAGGISYDLIGRAADVMLKEKKRLIIVPRETPFNDAHLKNMLSISRMNGIIIPASPGFYHLPKTINDLIDFVAAKVLNAMGIENNLLPEWNPC